MLALLFSKQQRMCFVYMKRRHFLLLFETAELIIKSVHSICKLCCFNQAVVLGQQQGLEMGWQMREDHFTHPSSSQEKKLHLYESPKWSISHSRAGRYSKYLVCFLSSVLLLKNSSSSIKPGVLWGSDGQVFKALFCNVISGPNYQRRGLHLELKHPRWVLQWD